LGLLPIVILVSVSGSRGIPWSFLILSKEIEMELDSFHNNNPFESTTHCGTVVTSNLRWCTEASSSSSKEGSVVLNQRRGFWGSPYQPVGSTTKLATLSTLPYRSNIIRVSR
jgi:hypothetical protein